jgi:hypothetical protein
MTSAANYHTIGHTIEVTYTALVPRYGENVADIATAYLFDLLMMDFGEDVN